MATTVDTSPAASGVAIAPDLAVAATTEASPAPQPSERIASAEYLDQPQFHRSLTLPATDAHGELKVTYAVAGAQSDTARTVLFIGGMMGGRFLAVLGDYLSEKHGLRLVVTDRPGMGGSTNVDPSQRISVWLETVPVLLKELNVKHVSIFAHSCGVIYALNTLAAFPDILPPSDPTLHLFSPWVHPQHSGVKMMAASSILPSPLINHFSSVLSFVNQVVAPSLTFSSGIFSSSSGLLGPSSSSTSANEEDKPKHERDSLCREYRGLSASEVAAQSDEVMRRIWKEDTTAANGEALLSLRKPEAGSWGVCEDYEKCPSELEARINAQPASASNERRKLTIAVFWAETDMMVGKKGEEYFDKCFKSFCSEQTTLQYRSEVTPDTNHDTLCHPQYGALSKALDDVAARA